MDDTLTPVDPPDTAPQPPRRVSRFTVLAVVLAVIGLLFAAYELGQAREKDSPTAAPSAADTNPRHAQAVAFVKCLRENGVPNFPDPLPDGGIGIRPEDGVDVAGETYKKADEACRSLAPPGPRNSPGKGQPSGGASPGATGASPGAKGQAPAGGQTAPDTTKYVACMRKHGLPDFPEPDAQGMFTGIDVTTDAFKSAQAACESTLPSGGPPPPS